MFIKYAGYFIIMSTIELPVNVCVENIEITEIAGKMHLKVGEHTSVQEFKYDVKSPSFEFL